MTPLNRQVTQTKKLKYNLKKNYTALSKNNKEKATRHKRKETFQKKKKQNEVINGKKTCAMMEATLSLSTVAVMRLFLR